MIVKPVVSTATLRKRPPHVQDTSTSKPAQTGTGAVAGTASTRSSIASVKSEDGSSTSATGHSHASLHTTNIAPQALPPPAPPSTSIHNGYVS
jgi:hypothetical protein